MLDVNELLELEQRPPGKEKSERLKGEKTGTTTNNIINLSHSTSFARYLLVGLKPSPDFS